MIVDLASVHTGIDIRDQRMRDMFFKVAEFPTADFYSSVDVATAADLAVGESVDIPLVGKVRVHRIFADVKTVVTAVKLTEDRIMLTSKEPILLNASSLGLSDGVEMLRSVAKPSGNQLGRAHNLSVTVSKNHLGRLPRHLIRAHLLGLLLAVSTDCGRHGAVRSVSERHPRSLSRSRH